MNRAQVLAAPFHLNIHGHARSSQNRLGSFEKHRVSEPDRGVPSEYDRGERRETGQPWQESGCAFERQRRPKGRDYDGRLRWATARRRNDGGKKKDAIGDIGDALLRNAARRVTSPVSKPRTVISPKKRLHRSRFLQSCEPHHS
jgi:hypothetical protein